MTMNSRIKNGLGWFTAAILYFGIYGVNLQVPGETYYDEVYFVKTAREIIHLSGYTETSHPPFGKLLIALNILIFGDYSWVWRLSSLVSGFGCLLLLYMITKLLTKNSRVAFFAAFLFSLDGVSFTQARIAMFNAPMLFLMLLSVWCLVQHTVTHDWTRRKAFFWSGICFGFSIGTRLVGLSIGAVLLMFYGVLWAENGKKRLLIEDAVYFLILTPLIVYESTYWVIPFIHGFDWSTVWKLQRGMITYHLHLTKGHTYSSEWWTWPLMIRPIWYHYHPSVSNGVKMVQGVLCIGNPLIFWLIPVAMVFAIVRLVKSRSLAAGFIVTGFFTQWFQWAPVSRVKFFHYIYTVMPFVAMALALILDKLWQSGQAGKGAVVVYLVLIVAMFIYWFPLLNGMPISEVYFRQHMWFRSWI